MKIILETKRLYLREMTVDDAENAYRLNLDPEVIRYTGDDAFESIEAARKFLAAYNHYQKYGFGRWGMINKLNNEFIGWCGLKFTPELNEVDIGYRLIKKYWKLGYATEAANACLVLGFSKFGMEVIVGRVMKENMASISVLEKIGLSYLEERNCGGEDWLVYQIKKNEKMQQTTFKYSLEGQETERLIFRKVVQEDFNTWLEFCRTPDSLKYIFSQEQLMIEDPTERCKIWFDRVFNRYKNHLGGMNILIDKTTNKIVGQCGLLIQNIEGVEELEIGYSLMPDARKKGYALEAAKKCRNFAFENNFASSLISVIHAENKDSVKVAMGNGMVLDKTTIQNGDPVFIFRVHKAQFLSEGSHQILKNQS